MLCVCPNTEQSLSTIEQYAEKLSKRYGDKKDEKQEAEVIDADADEESGVTAANAVKGSSSIAEPSAGLQEQEPTLSQLAMCRASALQPQLKVTPPSLLGSVVVPALAA